MYKKCFRIMFLNTILKLNKLFMFYNMLICYIIITIFDELIFSLLLHTGIGMHICLSGSNKLLKPWYFMWQLTGAHKSSGSWSGDSHNVNCFSTFNIPINVKWKQVFIYWTFQSFF